jgi:hypothetical protein
VYRVLVGKPKRRLGGTWPRWEDSIKMDLQEVGVPHVNWPVLQTQKSEKMVSFTVCTATMSSRLMSKGQFRRERISVVDMSVSPRSSAPVPFIVFIYNSRQLSLSRSKAFT